jgi:hypothetical protein
LLATIEDVLKERIQRGIACYQNIKRVDHWEKTRGKLANTIRFKDKMPHYKSKIITCNREY